MAISDSSERKAVSAISRGLGFLLGSRGGRRLSRVQNPLIPPAPGSSEKRSWLPRGEVEDLGWAYRQAGVDRPLSARELLKTPLQRVVALPVLVLVVITVALLMTVSPSGPARRRAAAVQEPAVVVSDSQEQMTMSNVEIQPVVETSEPIPPKTDNAAVFEVEAPAKPVVKDESPVQAAGATEVMPKTAGVIVREPKAKRLIVKGILYSQDNPAAIVDDQIVHVGDVISGVSIVGITKGSVVFEKQQARWSHKVQETE